MTFASVARSVAFLTLWGIAHPAVQAGECDPLVLENAVLRLELDAQHGTLLRLLDKQGAIDLRPPSGLAEGFRLLVPLPADPYNYVRGEDQVVSQVDRSQHGLSIRFAGPLEDPGHRRHDLAATLSVTLADRALVCQFNVENRTEHTVSEIWYPALGGLLGFGPLDHRAATTLNPPPHNHVKFQPPFGRHFVGYPGQHNMGFVEINNSASNQAMYLGAHDKVARFKGFYFQERSQGATKDVAVNLIHFPFLRPGQDFQGSPLVIQFHPGDWLDGGKQIYRPWFEQTFGLMTPNRDWIRQHGFYQMIMIMLPEGNINYKIRDIPQLARDGLEYGVTSLQIAGWQRGGHDNGYPYYEPDPRLGTWDDLQSAIRQCHELGVQVYFFVNIHVNNLDTQWYRDELHGYNFENMNGYPYAIAGWGMGTLSSRMAHTVPLMSFCDVSFPGLRDRLLGYFKKLAEIGADGIHIDKCFPQPLNFNPRLRLGPDEAPWEGTIQLVDQIARECRAVQPEFRISFETSWDRTLQYGNATWWAGNMAVARMIFPELVETVGGYQPFDFVGINDAVREGYAVMVAPHRFNRSMAAPAWRGLSQYICQVKRIRDELADVFFFGEFLATEGAELQQVEPNGAVQWAGYRSRTAPVQGCIVTNRAATAASLRLVRIGQHTTGAVRIHGVGTDPVSATLPATITVAPERLVFVVQE